MTLNAHNQPHSNHSFYTYQISNKTQTCEFDYRVFIFQICSCSDVCFFFIVPKCFFSNSTFSEIHSIHIHTIYFDILSINLCILIDNKSTITKQNHFNCSTMQQWISYEMIRSFLGLSLHGFLFHFNSPLPLVKFWSL